MLDGADCVSGKCWACGGGSSVTCDHYVTCDQVMLSGETANGDFPIECVTSAWLMVVKMIMKILLCVLITDPHRC